jgi:hypothetical protein
MDLDPKLNDERADDALRATFKAAGHWIPSAGFEQRILHRIAVLPQPVALLKPKPLMPIWGWVLAAVILVVFLPCALSKAVNDTTDTLLPAFRIDLSAIWSSPWLVMSAATATALVALNALLAQRTFKTDVAMR